MVAVAAVNDDVDDQSCQEVGAEVGGSREDKGDEQVAVAAQPRQGDEDRGCDRRKIRNQPQDWVLNVTHGLRIPSAGAAPRLSLVWIA